MTTETPETLNARMEFGHVIEVHRDGTVTDPSNVYAPSLLDDELDGGIEWELLNGYSGQYSYSGPIMHNSEYVGGRMARDILARPGYYVVIDSRYSHAADCEHKDGWHEPNGTCDPDDGDYWEGWAVAFKPSRETED